jgi:hypothetical protein
VRRIGTWGRGKGWVRPLRGVRNRGRELRAQGANMDWDQALAYTLTQATQALNDLESAARPE